MKMAFALLFFFENSTLVDESKTVFYRNLQNCRYMCQELSKQQRNYYPTECICRLMWVDSKTKVLL